jgi:hypothetical protein
MTNDPNQQDGQLPDARQGNAGDGTMRKGITVDQLKNWTQPKRVEPYGDHDIEIDPSGCSTIEAAKRALSSVGSPPLLGIAPITSQDLLEAGWNQLANALQVPRDIPIGMVTAADALKAAGLTGIDQLSQTSHLQKAIDRMTGAWFEQFQENLSRLSESMASHIRRNRDRAVQHITDDYVGQVVDRIDWSTFITAQREGVDDPDDQLVERLEATLQDDDRQDVRDAIARELLLIAWSHAAYDLRYDGDQTEPLEWEDPETGGLIEHIATPDDVTAYMFREYLDTDDHWRQFADEYIERDILEVLLQPIETTPPSYVPAIRDGVGEVITNGVANGFRRWGTGGWLGPENLPPETRHVWGKPGNPLSGEVLYSMDPALITTAADGWEIVRSLDDADVDTFDFIGMKWMANRDCPGPYDGIYVTADEILESQGIKKHHKGGYRARDRAAVAARINRLRTITTHSRMLYVPKGKKTPQIVEISSPLIVVSHWVDIRTYDGVQYPTKWYVRPGDWAASYFDIAPQYAPMLGRLLQLTAGTDYIPKRLGRFLVELFRFRKTRDTYDQPYVIRNLLDGVRIPVRRNIGEFRASVEDGLNVLRDDVGMIEGWGYVDDIPAKGRGWREQWLGTRIWIKPTTPAIGKPFTKPRRRGRRAIPSS